MGDATTDEATVVQASPGLPVADLPPVGSRLSRFVVLEEVGRGGMGRVLRAYDPKLQREVALKRLRVGSGDRDANARLVAEARAMARLSHPNVVAVYDVEEPERGEFVLVMEFVAGKTLKAWLHDERPGWRTIVDRFVEAGRGLTAAHEAGILHRDFKPSNVLVADNAVKVGDFGIAKGIGKQPTTRNATTDMNASADDLTGTGTVIGTPRYMAPEQHRGEPLDAATDQYAFCVALWEALYGAPPFSGDTIARDKAQGPPPSPHRDVPGPIARAVVRGLSPDPRHRWPSMDGLLDALTAQTSRRRTGWAVALIGAGAVGAVGMRQGLATPAPCTGAAAKLEGIWDEGRRDAVRTRFQAIDRRYADEAWSRTERIVEAHADRWVAAHTEACEATTVRGERSARMMDLQMACLHRAAVDLDAAVDVLADADADVVQNAHVLTNALPDLARCEDLDALTADVQLPPADLAEVVEAARVRLAAANSLRQAGRYVSAKEAVDEAAALLDDVDFGPAHSELALADGLVLDHLGRYTASREALERSVHIGARWGQWSVVQRAAVRLMTVLGEHEQQVDQALRHQPLAAGLSENDPVAEAAYVSAVAAVHLVAGDYPAAEREHRAALLLRQEALGPEHPDVATARHALAGALFAQGRHAEAEAEHRAALAVRIAALGPEHPDVATAQSNLAGTLYAQGKIAEAEEVCRAALELRTATLGADHPEVASLHNNLGMLLGAQGKYAEAAEENRRALDVREAALGAQHPSNAITHNNLATMLRALGKLEESESEHRAALALWESSLGPDHFKVAVSSGNLATVLLELGRPDEAVSFAERGWANLRTNTNRPAAERAASGLVLARALAEASTPDEARARAVALDSRAILDKADAGGEVLDELEAWLKAHDRAAPIPAYPSG